MKKITGINISRKDELLAKHDLVQTDDQYVVQYEYSNGRRVFKTMNFNEYPKPGSNYTVHEVIVNEYNKVHFDLDVDTSEFHLDIEQVIRHIEAHFKLY